MALAYITCRDKKEANKITIHLLRKRLIACANVFPIKSMYWWNNKIAGHNEYAIFAKTNDENFKKLEIEVKKIHSYEIPCILKLDAVANKEYEKWSRNEMGSR